MTEAGVLSAVRWGVPRRASARADEHRHHGRVLGAPACGLSALLTGVTLAAVLCPVADAALSRRSEFDADRYA